MINPWPFVDADDDLVADLLAGIVALVLELGGWLNPEARIVAREGHVHVECAASDGQPLVLVPAQAFVRVGRVSWSAGADRLEVVDQPADLPGSEQELLILQTALLNACGKVPWLAATHPVLAPDLDPAVVDAVRAFRPSFRRRRPTPAGLLWSTRAFRLPTLLGDTPEPVAVPIVDLLDHRAGGATGTFTGDGLAVDVRHAGTQSTAWLDYGLQRDAIGMAVVYGFADVTCPVAHSAPCTIEVPGAGSVRVAARGRTRFGELLPPRVDRDDAGVVVSHLTFGESDAAGLAAALADGAGWDVNAARRAVVAVAQRNVELADALVDRAESSASPAARVLADAALRQRSVVAPYAS